MPRRRRPLARAIARDHTLKGEIPLKVERAAFLLGPVSSLEVQKSADEGTHCSRYTLPERSRRKNVFIFCLLCGDFSEFVSPLDAFSRQMETYPE